MDKDGGFGEGELGGLIRGKLGNRVRSGPLKYHLVSVSEASICLPDMPKQGVPCV